MCVCAAGEFAMPAPAHAHVNSIMRLEDVLNLSYDSDTAPLPDGCCSPAPTPAQLSPPPPNGVPSSAFPSSASSSGDASPQPQHLRAFSSPLKPKSRPPDVLARSPGMQDGDLGERRRAVSAWAGSVPHALPPPHSSASVPPNKLAARPVGAGSLSPASLRLRRAATDDAEDALGPLSAFPWQINGTSSSSSDPGTVVATADLGLCSPNSLQDGEDGAGSLSGLDSSAQIRGSIVVAVANGVPECGADGGIPPGSVSPPTPVTPSDGARSAVEDLLNVPNDSDLVRIKPADAPPPSMAATPVDDGQGRSSAVDGDVAAMECDPIDSEGIAPRRLSPTSPAEVLTLSSDGSEPEVPDNVCNVSTNELALAPADTMNGGDALTLAPASASSDLFPCPQVVSHSLLEFQAQQVARLLKEKDLILKKLAEFMPPPDLKSWLSQTKVRAEEPDSTEETHLLTPGHSGASNHSCSRGTASHHCGSETHSGSTSPRVFKPHAEAAMSQMLLSALEGTCTGVSGLDIAGPAQGISSSGLSSLMAPPSDLFATNDLVNPLGLSLSNSNIAEPRHPGDVGQTLTATTASSLLSTVAPTATSTAGDLGTLGSSSTLWAQSVGLDMTAGCDSVLFPNPGSPSTVPVTPATTPSFPDMPGGQGRGKAYSSLYDVSWDSSSADKSVFSSDEDEYASMESGGENSPSRAHKHVYMSAAHIRSPSSTSSTGSSTPERMSLQSSPRSYSSDSSDCPPLHAVMPQSDGSVSSRVRHYNNSDDHYQGRTPTRGIGGKDLQLITAQLDVASPSSSIPSTPSDPSLRRSARRRVSHADQDYEYYDKATAPHTPNRRLNSPSPSPMLPPRMPNLAALPPLRASPMVAADRGSIGSTGPSPLIRSWSRQEDAVLLAAHTSGIPWRDIAQHLLPHRTEGGVKSRWTRESNNLIRDGQRGVLPTLAPGWDRGLLRQRNCTPPSSVGSRPSSASGAPACGSKDPNAPQRGRRRGRKPKHLIEMEARAAAAAAAAAAERMRSESGEDAMEGRDSDPDQPRCSVQAMGKGSGKDRAARPRQPATTQVSPLTIAEALGLGPRLQMSPIPPPRVPKRKRGSFGESSVPALDLDTRGSCVSPSMGPGERIRKNSIKDLLSGRVAGNGREQGTTNAADSQKKIHGSDARAFQRRSSLKVADEDDVLPSPLDHASRANNAVILPPPTSLTLIGSPSRTSSEDGAMTQPSPRFASRRGRAATVIELTEDEDENEEHVDVVGVDDKEVQKQQVSVPHRKSVPEMESMPQKESVPQKEPDPRTPPKAWTLAVGPTVLEKRRSPVRPTVVVLEDDESSSASENEPGDGRPIGPEPDETDGLPKGGQVSEKVPPVVPVIEVEICRSTPDSGQHKSPSKADAVGVRRLSESAVAKACIAPAAEQIFVNPTNVVVSPIIEVAMAHVPHGMSVQEMVSDHEPPPMVVSLTTVKSPAAVLEAEPMLRDSVLKDTIATPESVARKTPEPPAISPTVAPSADLVEAAASPGRHTSLSPALTPRKMRTLSKPESPSALQPARGSPLTIRTLPSPPQPSHSSSPPARPSTVASDAHEALPSIGSSSPTATPAQSAEASRATSPWRPPSVNRFNLIPVVEIPVPAPSVFEDHHDSWKSMYHWHSKMPRLPPMPKSAKLRALERLAAGGDLFRTISQRSPKAAASQPEPTSKCDAQPTPEGLPGASLTASAAPSPGNSMATLVSGAPTLQSRLAEAAATVHANTIASLLLSDPIANNGLPNLDLSEQLAFPTARQFGALVAEGGLFRVASPASNLKTMVEVVVSSPRQSPQLHAGLLQSIAAGDAQNPSNPSNEDARVTLPKQVPAGYSSNARKSSQSPNADSGVRTSKIRRLLGIVKERGSGKRNSSAQKVSDRECVDLSLYVPSSDEEEPGSLPSPTTIHELLTGGPARSSPAPQLRLSIVRKRKVRSASPQPRRASADGDDNPPAAKSRRTDAGSSNVTNSNETVMLTSSSGSSLATSPAVTPSLQPNGKRGLRRGRRTPALESVTDHVAVRGRSRSSTSRGSNASPQPSD